MTVDGTKKVQRTCFINNVFFVSCIVRQLSDCQNSMKAFMSKYQNCVIQTHILLHWTDASHMLASVNFEPICKTCFANQHHGLYKLRNSATPS